MLSGDTVNIYRSVQCSITVAACMSSGDAVNIYRSVRRGTNVAARMLFGDAVTLIGAFDVAHKWRRVCRPATQ